MKAKDFDRDFDAGADLTKSLDLSKARKVCSSATQSQGFLGLRRLRSPAAGIINSTLGGL
jgi:hypothetical protein